MLARSSRSRSRTVETPTRISLHTSSVGSLNQESDNSSSRDLLPTLTPDPDEKPKPSSTTMITTMTSQSASGANIPVVLTDVSEDADVERATARSSSLSELSDNILSDLQPDNIPRGQFSRGMDVEVDSEAETERLDKSPHKQIVKSGRDQTTDMQNGLARQTDSTSDELNDAKASLQSVEADELTPLPKSDGKGSLGKRKRPQSGITTPSILDIDEPSPKRALIDEMQLDLIEAQLNADIDAAEYEFDDGGVAEDAPSNAQEPNGHIETDTAENEEDTVVRERKPRPGRKGRRKGIKPAFATETETAAEVSDTPAIDTEPVDEEAEEEDDQSPDEAQAKRKVAAVALADIEKDFMMFREKHLGEQLEQVDYELQLLRRPSCTHPDFLAQLKSVDERRDQKILYEDRLLAYNLENLTMRTVAERQQLHSQYFQEIRQIRDNAIKRCYQELYALQRDRWRFGSGEKSSLPLYNPKRADQLSRQTSYNMEVSLLSGIAKYVGFPAAPDMSSLESDEIGHDLQLMGINVARVENTARTPALTTDRSIAEEQFFEQTPWANPQHPAHANATIQNFHTQTAPIQFLTPVLQKRNVDVAAINGSASTIEMASNPPSSAAGPSQHRVESPLSMSQNGRIGLKDADRIQTTHASTTSSRDNPVEQKPAQPERDTDFANIAQYHQYHSLGSRRSLLNSTSPPSTNRSLGAEILGPTPQRAVIAAPIANSPGRFGP